MDNLDICGPRRDEAHSTTTCGTYVGAAPNADKAMGALALASPVRKRLLCFARTAMITCHLWNWIGRFVREPDCRGMRASTASSLLVCSRAAFIAVRYALLLRRKKKMFDIIQPPLRLRKRDSAPVCVAGRNARPELRRGQGLPTRFREL